MPFVKQRLVFQICQERQYRADGAEHLSYSRGQDIMQAVTTTLLLHGSASHKAKQCLLVCTMKVFVLVA